MNTWDKVSRRRLVAEIVGRPIGWASGAATASIVGLLNMDIVSAFILGFMVGLIHDVTLYYLHVIGYGARVRGIGYDEQFAVASRLFSDGDWQGALSIVQELHSSWPSHKGTLYLLIRCYDKAGRWDGLLVACDKYVTLHPRKDEIAEIEKIRQNALGQLQQTS